MIKAILFDLDNTLIDFITMKRRCCEAAIDAMRRAGLKLEKKKALKTLFRLYEKYGIEHKEIFQKFLKATTKKVDYKIVAYGIVAYRKLKESYLAPYPKTISTLKKLKKQRKLKLAIISDAPRMRVWLRLVTMRIDKFFLIVITAADVRKQKTYKAPFTAALKALKIRPEEALMVGDNIKRDIKPAKALGIRTCFARYGAAAYLKKPIAKGKSGADFEIENITELLRVKLD